ncbi:MAG TPA: cold shock and DUF1294 domain-containing protein [Burkholderiales bacterium]|jgi:uncharacterized membrane protein YsdA (DUF1294 family)/cold shock CspA family protein|nr:cold shock and DUF1294 domain-containing protein [Burkholderiales bacterium]
MRLQGRITHWKDDKGYGFIAPVQGGEPVFVHVRSFSRADRRPLAGDAVTYESGRDEKGRPRAVAVAYVDDRRWSFRFPISPRLATVAAFVLLLSVLAMAHRLPPWVLGFYGVLSVATFVLYALDKRAAREDRDRTPETRLHLLAVLGGWPGALAAQALIRHKSSKVSFQVVFWATVALNCGAFWWLFYAPGAQGLRRLLLAVAQMPSWA